MGRGKSQYKRKNTREDIVHAVVIEMNKRGYHFTYSVSTDDVRNYSRHKPEIKPDGNLPKSKQHRNWWTKDHAQEIVKRICDGIVHKYACRCSLLDERCEAIENPEPIQMVKNKNASFVELGMLLHEGARLAVKIIQVIDEIYGDLENA